MAKKRGGVGKIVWQAQPDDAIRLAALRWFCLAIEQKCIEIYATDKGYYPHIEKRLHGLIDHLKGMKDLLGPADPEGCPDGYFLCRDGFCAPMCSEDPWEQRPKPKKGRDD